jgi:hypothetical protein
MQFDPVSAVQTRMQQHMASHVKHGLNVVVFTQLQCSSLKQRIVSIKTSIEKRSL